jgi:hypothetical protein
MQYVFSRDRHTTSEASNFKKRRAPFKGARQRLARTSG